MLPASMHDVGHRPAVATKRRSRQHPEHAGQLARTPPRRDRPQQARHDRPTQQRAGDDSAPRHLATPRAPATTSPSSRRRSEAAAPGSWRALSAGALIRPDKAGAPGEVDRPLARDSTSRAYPPSCATEIIPPSSAVPIPDHDGHPGDVGNGHRRLYDQPKLSARGDVSVHALARSWTDIRRCDNRPRRAFVAPAVAVVTTLMTSCGGLSTTVAKLPALMPGRAAPLGGCLSH
jgi:hypothetical protein